MHKSLFAVGVLVTFGLLFTACDDDVANTASSAMEDAKVDTLVVRNIDTLVVNNVDTLVLKNVDTLVLSKVDTVLSKDTIYVKDTVVFNDTAYAIDTLVIKDSLIIKDTLVIKDSLVIKDTVVMVDGVEGSVKDARDGQVYKTIKIGDQVWMAENLNFDYGVKNVNKEELSYCRDDLAGNCRLYGRLYTWSAAMDSVGLFSDDGIGCGYGRTCSPKVPVRGICMKGWHLPSASEWKELFEFVGSTTAGVALRSKDEWSWDNSGETRKVTYGTDKFGFGVLPYGAEGAKSVAYGYSAFSTSSELTEEEYTMIVFWGSYKDVLVEPYGKDYAISRDRGTAVRCVRD